ncbi:glycosyltransferase family 61 protein [Psychrobacter sp. DAB_AL43B]|uniref:glycosyltransferase family 61 protein n=1 Tax=Psychrobacter sp. DAB_AL43B TaxID=1028416 RepID=UPI0009A78585|nr:glycosyltransferase family 61 protein [Psychrobacter sp. DAB_AL43B]SLJ84845.1 hypothetical protein DABAL43B_1650 [Psychrobacter sp. DAB_AL43B]
MLEDLERARKSVSNRIKVIRFKLRHKRLKKLSLENLSNYILLEKNTTECASVSPKYNDQDQCKLNYPIIDIKLYKLNNVFCNINSASFATEDIENIYIEEFPYINCEQANYKSGFLIKHDSHFAYVKNIKKDKVKRVRSAFFLGGNGSFNFYHWMIEIIPKLLYLNNKLLIDNDIDTIIVDRSVKDSPNYKWLLDKCMSHLSNININYVASDEVFYVENLFFLNTFNQTVFNLNIIKNHYDIHTIYNSNSLKKLRSRLLECTEESKVPYYSKVFLLRDDNTVSKYNRRSYNQDEVFSFFKQKGFIGIYPDKLSLSEQVNLFKSADFIVGPSGASWSNLIFSKNMTIAISWLPMQYKFFDTYSTLAYLNGVDMRFLDYKTVDEYAHGPYNINVNDIANIYYEMIAK